MGVSLIEKLFAAGEAVTGKAYRMLAARRQRDGVAQPLITDNFGSLLVGFGNETGTKDIFTRLRVSEPTSLFEGKQVFDKNALAYVESLVTGGTVNYLVNESSSNLTVTSTTGSQVIRQSRQYVPYEPGRTQYMILTGTIGTAVSGIRKRMGYFDAQNGIFLEQTVAGGLQFARRTFVTGSAVDSTTAQASWNIDPLDGSGPSGKTLGVTDITVMFIEFGWLGGAGIRIGFYIQGDIVYAHEFDLNGVGGVFMTTPNLPIRYEITNVSAGAGASFKQTCAVAFSESGFDPSGVVCTQPRYTAKSVSDTRVPIISVRLKSAYNRGLLIPLGAKGIVTSVDDLICDVVVRGSLTGPSWVDTDTGRTEYDITATAITGGVRVASFFANDNGGGVDTIIADALAVAADFAGTTDIISLVARTDTGSANVLGSLTWKELI